MPDVVLITEDEYRKGESYFRGLSAVASEAAPADEARLATAVASRQCRAVIVGARVYCGALYEALGRVAAGRPAIIARFGVGHDGIDKALARQHGVVVTNTPGVLDVSVAEHAIWLLGGLARHVAPLDARLRAGQFSPQTGIELSGKLLGVVGFGAIGRRVARIAHFGLGMRVWGADQWTGEELAAREKQPIRAVLESCGLETYTNRVDDLFSNADAISLHLPGTAATRNFVDARRLALMRPGGLLVNTARGSVIDEEALFDALASGRLAGAALDVFQQEPYQPVRPDKDLRALPAALLTPHVGSNTREANLRMAAASMENVRALLAGQMDRLARVDR